MSRVRRVQSQWSTPVGSSPAAMPVDLTIDPDGDLAVSTVGGTPVAYIVGVDESGYLIADTEATAGMDLRLGPSRDLVYALELE